MTSLDHAFGQELHDHQTSHDRTELEQASKAGGAVFVLAAALIAWDRGKRPCTPFPLVAILGDG